MAMWAPTLLTSLAAPSPTLTSPSQQVWMVLLDPFTALLTRNASSSCSTSRPSSARPGPRMTLESMCRIPSPRARSCQATVTQSSARPTRASCVSSSSLTSTSRTTTWSTSWRPATRSSPRCSRRPARFPTPGPTLTPAQVPSWCTSVSSRKTTTQSYSVFLAHSVSWPLRSGAEPSACPSRDLTLSLSSISSRRLSMTCTFTTRRSEIIASTKKHILMRETALPL